MGNDIENMNKRYYLKVNFIGYGENNKRALNDLIKSLKVKNIKKSVSQKNEEDLINIFDYWDYHNNFNKGFNDQCNDIFNNFIKIRDQS